MHAFRSLSLAALMGLCFIGTSFAATRHVWQHAPSPGFPYDNWETAAHTIQAAVDVAQPGDVVLVTNGVYETGTRVTPGHFSQNRVVITNDIVVRSVNGADVTIIRGQKEWESEAVRCVYMNAGLLVGFSLMDGSTRYGAHPYDGTGGGINMYPSTTAVASNCVISGNGAWEGEGGGAYGSTLYNCIVSNNGVAFYDYYDAYPGGGVSQSTLYNCSVVRNTALNAGGAAGSTLYNCTVSGNTAIDGGGGTAGCTLYNCTVSGNSALEPMAGGAEGGTLYNSIVYGNQPWDVAGVVCRNTCTIPLQAGEGNIAVDPRFVDAAAGDYRLSYVSPCSDAGANAFVHGTTDLDGNPRIMNGTVDMGAYESQIWMSPTGGQVVPTRRPALSWPAALPATWYQIWINRNGQKYLEQWVPGASTWTPPVYLPGGNYQWWLRPWSLALGYGRWSAAAGFSIPVAIPGVLTQIAPMGAQTGHDLNYRWQKDANATWYHLWVGRIAAGTWHDRWFDLVGTGEAAVNPGGAYPGPAKPIQIAPQNAIATNRPNFQWSGGACAWWLQGWGPDGYSPWSGPMEFSIPHAAETWCRVYVNRGATMVVDQWTQGESLLAPKALSWGVHSWWLGVWDARQNRTIWSDRMDFTVQ